MWLLTLKTILVATDLDNRAAPLIRDFLATALTR